MKPVFKRVVLKLSGEALQGRLGYGIDYDVTNSIARQIKEVKKLGLYCGIQILAAGNKEALAVAKAAELDFIRAEGFVFAHVADEG